ncbi:MAG: cupin domain-containing protein [Candidatus Omnitrophica bacterium]|nr:cupin domain-containing protein [Candidatus Omnitrophota bacterium]
MKIGKKIKTFRKERKITLKELSEKSGVQIATLSRIENDIMTGTLQSHIGICKALGISLSDFYREVEEDHKTLSLIRQKEKRQSFVHSKKSSTEMLAAKVMSKQMMPLLIKIQKGGETHKEENKVGTEKFVYVLEGKLRAKIGKEEYRLSKGDSIYFEASLPHVFYNNSKGEARVIVVLTPPSF